MKRQQRLFGIDLFRGLAIYAVVIQHTDQGILVQPLVWSWIKDFARFAVPFFLATAFYLAIDKLYRSQSPYLLPSRLTRLLIPYSVWTFFYLLYKALKWTVAGESSKILGLFQDPLSLFFFGGAAFHLYFLPLLVTGTLLLKFSEFLIQRQVSWRELAIAGLSSVLIYEILLVSNYDPNGFNIPFQPLLATAFPSSDYNPIARWVLVELAYTLRCLPYILVGMLLLHPDARNCCLKLTDRYPFLWLLLFFICNAFGSLVLPQAVYEIARGYTALLAAIALSNYLKDYAPIGNLALCSFGIYLGHLFFVEIFQSVAVRVDPDYMYHINTATLIAISIIILLISWGTTLLLMRYKNLSRVMFGY